MFATRVRRAVNRARPANIGWPAGSTAALVSDALFLLVMGALFAFFELLSHFFAIGPQGDRFYGSPYTIGFFEAHGLAALIGLLLFRALRHADRQFWHGFALAVHLLLGGANLTFWGIFTFFGLEMQGVMVTSVHALFVLWHLGYVIQLSNRSKYP
ncbi:MAG: hypothetical protein KJZ93_09520 [Caldilineaceae bacterium]|nr:hypothetical protein [Caldilineaceae bacterium]